MAEPVTRPVGSTKALVLLLVHEPLGVRSDKLIVPPTQTAEGPDIAAGTALTVTGAVTLQPVPGIAYLMVVTPAVTPVTIPDVPTVAPPESALHVPPEVASESAVVAPWHTVSVPVIATGVILTVTFFTE